MAAKWTKTDDGVYRDGELIATLNADGIPTVVKGKENMKSMVKRFLNGFEPEDKADDGKDEKDEGQGDDGKDEREKPQMPGADVPLLTSMPEEKPVPVPAEIPLPPPMDPMLGSKTPAFAAWKKKYNPTYEQLCRMVPSIKQTEKKELKK